MTETVEFIVGLFSSIFLLSGFPEVEEVKLEILKMLFNSGFSTVIGDDFFSSVGVSFSCLKF